MSYSLNFSPDFFLAEGEPYDRSDKALNQYNNPISVWSAILSIPETEWKEMARDFFDCDADDLTTEAVFATIKETDTCSNLNSPVEVWIDPEGSFRVLVYDNL